VKRVFLLTLAVGLLLALPLHAQNVWSSKIDTFGNYVKQTANPNANGIVSVFTPATGITVNRIQLQAAGGQVCSTLPGIKVTDGTSSAFLAIPNTTGPAVTLDQFQTIAVQSVCRSRLIQSLR
jgi:hypothetical protein